MTDADTLPAPANRMRHDNPVTQEMIDGDERLRQLDDLLGQSGPEVLSQTAIYDRALDFIRANRGRFVDVQQSASDTGADPDHLDFTISGVVYNADRSRYYAFMLSPARKPAYEEDGGVSFKFHTARGLNEAGGLGSKSLKSQAVLDRALGNENDPDQVIGGATLNVANVRFGGDASFTGTGLQGLKNLNQEIFDTTVDTIIFAVEGFISPQDQS